MPDLSIQNIERISSYVKKQEITFSHLLDDLIDHICCDVESEMQNGLTFSEAYTKVKQKIGKRRLKEIQEETLYTVDTKYRNMKNTMKISGIIGTVLFGFAAMFKIMHWPGAGIMMTLGGLILAFIFLPSALGVLWKETHSRNRLFLFLSAFFAGMFFILAILFKVQHWPIAGILLSLALVSGILFFIPALIVNRFRDLDNKSKRPVYILGGFGIIFYATGLFFKIQHWPLATILMAAGLVILCIIVFPWYTWLSWKDESHIGSWFIFMVIGSLAIIIPGALFNLSLQYSYEDGFYPHQEQQQALQKYLYSSNSTVMSKYCDSLNYPKMEKIHSATTGLISLITNIQIKMVQESEGDPGVPAVADDQIIQTENGPEIQYRLLSRPFHPGPVSDFLMPGCSTREKLNTAILEYSNLISDLAPEGDVNKYESLLAPSVYLPAEITEKAGISLMSGLHSLELLKNSVLAV
jgi:hypothetical protein